MEEIADYVVIMEQPDGLPKLGREDSPEKGQQIRELCAQHIRSRITELTADGVLECIAITSSISASSFTISGSKDKVEKLQQYLKDKKIGDVCADTEVYVQL